MSTPIDPQLQTMIDNMPEKTGKTLEAWFEVLAAAGLERHGAMMKLLKGEHGVTHGFANTIVMLYRQRANGGPPAEEDLIAAQYTGSKAALLPIYEAVLNTVQAFGPDEDIAPKKTYVSLRRAKQFAIVQASTRTRVDLGLNLKGETPPERLEGAMSSAGCAPTASGSPASRRSTIRSRSGSRKHTIWPEKEIITGPNKTRAGLILT